MVRHVMNLWLRTTLLKSRNSGAPTGQAISARGSKLAQSASRAPLLAMLSPPLPTTDCDHAQARESQYSGRAGFRHGIGIQGDVMEPGDVRASRSAPDVHAEGHGRTDVLQGRDATKVDIVIEETGGTGSQDAGGNVRAGDKGARRAGI